MGETPYRDLPTDFMLYSAAYPIKYNADTSKLEISKFATGLNLRIYNLNKLAVGVKSLCKFTDR